MEPRLELTAARTSDDNGEIIVLVGRSVSQSRAIGEKGIVQEGIPIDFFDLIHSLRQISKLFHVETIDLQQVVDHLGLIVGHSMMAAGFLEKTIKHIGRVPPLRTNHEGRHIGQTGLQGHHHQIPHQTNEIASGKIRIGGLFHRYPSQFRPHRLEPLHLRLDGPDRLKILAKFLTIPIAESTLHGPRILKHQIGDLPKSLILLGGKQPPIHLPRIPDRGRQVAGPVP